MVHLLTHKWTKIQSTARAHRQSGIFLGGSFAQSHDCRVSSTLTTDTTDRDL